MKKLTWKVWMYGINFFLRVIAANLSIIFAIWSMVSTWQFSTGFNWEAYACIISIALWIIYFIFGHFLWRSMQKEEKIIYLTIRNQNSDEYISINNIKPITIKEFEKELFSKDEMDRVHELNFLKETLINTFDIITATKYFYYIIKFRKKVNELEEKIAK